MTCPLRITELQYWNNLWDSSSVTPIFPFIYTILMIQRIRGAVYKNMSTKILNIKKNNLLRSGKIKVRTESQRKEGKWSQDSKPRFPQSSLINKSFDFDLSFLAAQVQRKADWWADYCLPHGSIRDFCFTEEETPSWRSKGALWLVPEIDKNTILLSPSWVSMPWHSTSNTYVWGLSSQRLPQVPCEFFADSFNLKRNQQKA